MRVVVDTSALVSLAVGGVLGTAVAEFDVVTTERVRVELERTADFDDRHAHAAASVLDLAGEIQFITVDGAPFETSRIDDGEASCVAAVRETDAEFLVTDDFRALPELRAVVLTEVALSPIFLRALMKRESIDDADARAAFEMMAEGRDWLGAPIYRYARRLVEE